MADAATIITINLDRPIVRGEQQITSVQIRKPDSGSLRGLNLVDLGQLKVDALIKVIPRVTLPPITEPEVSTMDMADLMAIGAEIGGFLLQKRQLAAVREL
ncbi:MAG TPA: phage tail assembly protein [Sphingobium sp.]|uniref:phage tail assembly protein n=1 Tax=Sphingobium sp. TaxID=1912891 RepID=UPI002ED5638B